MRKKSTLILTLVILAIFLYLWLINETYPATPDTSYCGFSDEAEYLKVKNAMKYHGILYCEGDGKGNWWFYRDGQKIKLVKGVGK